MGVSINEEYLQINFNGILPCKASIWGKPIFRKAPYTGKNQLSSNYYKALLVHILSRAKMAKILEMMIVLLDQPESWNDLFFLFHCPFACWLRKSMTHAATPSSVGASEIWYTDIPSRRCPPNDVSWFKIPITSSI